MAWTNTVASMIKKIVIVGCVDKNTGDPKLLVECTDKNTSAYLELLVDRVGKAIGGVCKSIPLWIHNLSIQSSMLKNMKIRKINC